MEQLKRAISKSTALLVVLAMMLTMIPSYVSATDNGAYESEGQGLMTSVAMKDSASISISNITTDFSIEDYYSNSISTEIDASAELEFKFVLSGPGTSNASEDIIKQTALPYIGVYEEDDALSQANPKASYDSGNGRLQLKSIETYGAQPLITISIQADTLLPGSDYALVFDSGLSVGKENSTDVLGRDVIFFFNTKQQDGPLSLDKTSLSLSIGQTSQITASTDNKTVIAKWTSDSPDVVSVDNGYIRAISEGKAVVTAEYEGESAVCIVKVAGVEYGMQGSSDGNQFVIKDPSDITVLAETEDYYLNRINTRFSNAEDVNFIVMMSAGMQSFEESSFKSGNLPLIKVYNEDMSKIVAQSTPEEGQLELEYVKFEKTDVPEKNIVSGIYLKIEKGLKDGKYCLVVDKGLKGNAPNKIIGKDVIFQFRIANPNEQVPVNSLSLDREEVTVSKGAELKLNPTIEPYDATNKNITWSTSDEKVVSVENGVVTALSAGTADITAVSESGNCTAVCRVTVVESGITLNPLSLDMKIDQVEYLKAYDSAGERIYPKFSSDDDEVVSVDDDGKVKGISAGNATITAEYEDETVLCVISVQSSGRYMAQGISGNMLTMLSPDSIYQEEKTSNYFHNVFNEELDGSQEIVFGFTMSAGVNSFNKDDHFMKYNMPNIRIYDKYKENILAQYNNEEGQAKLDFAGFDEETKTIYISLPAKSLKNGTYCLVFDKTLCGNNNDKNIGCDIFFDFKVLCSIKNMEITLSDKSLEDEINAVKDEEQSFSEIENLTIKTAEGTAVTSEDFSFIRDKLGTTLKSLDLTDAALENDSLPAEALSGCTALKKLSTPESLKFIGENALSGCSSLDEVLFINAEEPPQLENVNAFEGTPITTIKVPVGTEGEYQTAAVWKDLDGITITRQPIRVIGMKLDKDTITIHARDSEAVSPIFTPTDADDKTVTWKSGDTSVATVEDGVIKGIKQGETTITATSNDGGYTATCKVVVEKPIYNHTIELNNISAALYTTGTDHTVQLKATISDPDGFEELKTENIEWQSSDPSVATVENGLVTGHKAGLAAITATLEGKSASCAVIVSEHTISLDRSTASIYGAGDDRSVTIKAAVDGTQVLGNTVKWSSSNTSIASVSNGIVLGKSPGTVTITATANEITAKCTVTVKSIAAPKTVTAASAAYNKIKVSWSGVTDASGYYIYRATSKTGTYTRIKSVSSKTRSYTDEGRTTGKTYYYKVYAYRTYSGSNKAGDSSAIKSAAPQLSKPGTPSISKYSKSYVKVKWKGISGESGYQVYRATSKSGKYTKVKSVTMTGSSYPYAKIKTTRNKTYYYKVRAYKKVGSSYVYSSWTTIKSYKLK